jgi:hypothetical protein
LSSSVSLQHREASICRKDKELALEVLHVDEPMNMVVLVWIF